MRWPALIMAAGAWASLCSAAPPDVQSGEPEVKAAVVFNVLQFVQWPPGSVAPDRTLVLCAPEGSRFAQALARYDGLRVRDATFSFRAIDRHMDHLTGCHAVFVESGDPYALLRVAAASRNMTILVLAEGDHAVQQCAGIGLSFAGNNLFSTSTWRRCGRPASR